MTVGVDRGAFETALRNDELECSSTRPAPKRRPASTTSAAVSRTSRPSAHSPPASPISGRPHAGGHFRHLRLDPAPLHHDHDGHEVRFYTTMHHTDVESVPTVHDPIETPARRHFGCLLGR